MKKTNGLLIGMLFIAAGLLYACRALGIFDFSIFFPGWWTLIIIVPCITALTKKDTDKTWPIIGLVVGLCLFVNQQDISFHIDFFPLLVAVLCILIGVKLMFPQNKRHRQEEDFVYYGTKEETSGNAGTKETQFNSTYAKNGSCYLNVSAILSGKDIRVYNECFTGADICTIMGGVDIDLRNAIISEDVYVNITAIMGGVDIAVPANVRVVSDGCNAILGGVDVGTAYVNHLGADAPKIFITGTCIMGGIDVK